MRHTISEYVCAILGAWLGGNNPSKMHPDLFLQAEQLYEVLGGPKSDGEDDCAAIISCLSVALALATSCTRLLTCL